MKSILSIGTLLIAATVSSFVGFGPQDQDKVTSADSAQETKAEEKQDARFEDKFEALDNMHHFMEYISQPSYRALRKELSAEPKDRRAWKSIKSHAMILTETASIVSLRVPEGASEEEAKQWKEISFAVYESGKEFYGAIGDFDKSKKHYEAMITSCNKCHSVFDNGKHQLGFYEKKK